MSPIKGFKVQGSEVQGSTVQGFWQSVREFSQFVNWSNGQIV